MAEVMGFLFVAGNIVEHTPALHANPLQRGIL